jgi:predicted CoA-binding protein
MPIRDDEGLDRLLDADTIAVIGCSTTAGKPAHDVPAYLQRHGYRIVPVNPFADRVLGEPAFDARSIS